MSNALVNISRRRRESPPPAVLRAVREGHRGGLIQLDRDVPSPFTIAHEPFGSHHMTLAEICVRCMVLRS